MQRDGRGRRAVDDVDDVALERRGQRQRGDASRAGVHQVSRHDRATSVLQVDETAHAGDQRHLRLRRYTRQRPASLKPRFRVKIKLL